MERVILGIGGNTGDRLKNLGIVNDIIEERVGSVILSSPIIESEPWGYESNNYFLNQILVVETEKKPDLLLSLCTDIETSLGRQRKANYADRTMDIDILFYGQLVYEQKGLIIPHPRLHERLFILKPLVSIYPDFLHPLMGKTAKELLESCKDKSKTWWFEEDYSVPLLP